MIVSAPQVAVSLVALCLAAVAAVALTGCSGAASGAKSPAKSETTKQVGASMAGPVQKIVISKQAVASKPRPWDLSDPKSAVQSYLDWTSYAYRIAESSAATPTMSAAEEVRVDSYLQFNLQKSRILDQALDSVVFGKPSAGATSTTVPVRENWTYRYVSISEVGKTLEGPYKAIYDATYTVIKNSKGQWVVDSVVAKALGEVK